MHSLESKPVKLTTYEFIQFFMLEAKKTKQLLTVADAMAAFEVWRKQ